MHVARRIDNILHELRILREGHREDDPVFRAADLGAGRQEHLLAVDLDDHFPDVADLAALGVLGDRAQLRERAARAQKRRRCESRGC